MTLRLSALALAALALTPASASTRTADQRALWATVNVCDTLRYPNQIGIRGSMPGADNPRLWMYMRFRVQFYDASKEKWRFSKAGDSGFKYVGLAKFKARQAGQRFTFDVPAGTSFRLRGKVAFQWRTAKREGAKQKVVRTAIRLTTAGHHSNSGSDPDGYSSDTCVMR